MPSDDDDRPTTFPLHIVLAIENVSNLQMHNEPRLFQRIFWWNQGHSVFFSYAFEVGRFCSANLAFRSRFRYSSGFSSGE